MHIVSVCIYTHSTQFNTYLWFLVGPVPGGKAPSQGALSESKNEVTHPKHPKQMIDMETQEEAVDRKQEDIFSIVLL